MTRIIVSSVLRVGEILRLTGEEHHYLSRVRRHRPGDTVVVQGDGGRIFDAQIEAVDKTSALLRIGEETAGFPVAPVTLAVAVPKRNLMDDVVRKLSEIGVLRLVPTLAKRTDFAPAADRLARWRRIADEALRQCGREAPLIVDPPVSFAAMVADPALPKERLLLHPTGPLRMTAAVPRRDPVVLAVGPEGGFTDGELVQGEAHGFTTVSLDMPVLRIETAALSAAVLAVALRDKKG